jgi:hypothetical protein
LKFCGHRHTAFDPLFMHSFPETTLAFLHTILKRMVPLLMFLTWKKLVC